MPIGFYFLCFCFCLVLCGWFGKIAYDQYIADQMREARARERRQAYERDKAYIKQINRRNLFVSWCEEANGNS